MFVRANFVHIYLQGMRDRSLRSGTALAREIQLTDWSTTRNLSNRSSGVQIPRNICTRLKRYLYSTKCSWTIKTNMDNRLFLCGIFIGLKKALDTVDHEILLRKLDHYGFSRHHKHLVFFLLARANSNNVASTFDVLSRR